MDCSIRCDKDFLSQISKKKPGIYDDYVNRWKSIFDLLKNSTDLQFDISTKEFLELLQTDKELYTILWKSNDRIEFNDDKNNIFNTDNCFPIFLIGQENTKVKRDSENFGILSLSYDDFIKKDDLFQEIKIPVQKSKTISWTSIPKHPCNSLVIIDNYVLKKKDDNLYEILNQILPMHLAENMSFQLSIFAQNLTEDNIAAIKTYLRKTRPKLSVEYSFHQLTPTDYHDRRILTNYIFISCEGGFDLVKKDDYKRQVAQKSTDIHCYYYRLRENESVNIFLTDIRKILKTKGTKDNNRLIND